MSRHFANENTETKSKWSFFPTDRKFTPSLLSESLALHRPFLKMDDSELSIIHSLQ